MIKRLFAGSDIPVYLLLFLTAFNLFAKFYYYAFLCVLIVFLRRRCVMINRTMVLYLLLGCLMAVGNLHAGLLAMIRCFLFVLMYAAGYHLTTTEVLPTTEVHAELPWAERSSRIQKKAAALILSMTLGSFAHYLANFLKSITSPGLSGRNTLDIWTNQGMAATGQAALGCLAAASAAAMVLYPIRRTDRLFGGLTITALLLYNMILAGRTLMILTLGLLFADFVYLLVRMKTVYPRVQMILGVLACGGLFAFVFVQNVGGLRDLWMESNLVRRFLGESGQALLQTDRMGIKLEFLRSMPDYPFGGLHLRAQYGYAHDLLLDAYDEYGIGVFLLLTVILITGIWEWFCLMKQEAYALPYLNLIACVYPAMLAMFLLEPIFAGFQWLFVTYCFINGIIAGMHAAAKRTSKERTDAMQENGYADC